METAMMDALIKSCKEKDIAAIKGYYYPTAKNSMVKDFFGQQGFEKVSEAEGKTEWLFEINDIYIDKNHLITIKRGEGNEM